MELHGCMVPCRHAGTCAGASDQQCTISRAPDLYSDCGVHVAEERKRDLELLQAEPADAGRAKQLIPKAADADDEDEGDESSSSSDDDDEVNMPGQQPLI